MNTGRSLTSICIAIVLLAPLTGSAAAQDPEPASPQAVTDFNGDWYADLAIGVPFEDVAGVPDAGAVNILYGGTGRGLSARNNRAWNQDVAGIAGTLEPNDRFGITLAVGDFDGNGRFDLAVGLPYEGVGSPEIVDSGAVQVLYGSTGGLAAAGNEIWSQDSTGIQDTAETSDLFGYALAAGDFDGDGYDDLAVGVPLEDVGSPEVLNAGAVNVLYGSATGLTAAGNQWWHQDSDHVEGGIEANDRFGLALTAGDFNGDGRADLAVGAPMEAIDTITGAGAVNILYGSASGLTATGDQMWQQNSPGIADTAEVDDYFGLPLTAGDFDGDGYDDLAVGVPTEDLGSPEISNAGAVNVLYGSTTGLTAAGNQWWHQDSDYVEGMVEADDRFGFALTAGDFNGDGRADLAVGVPYENKGIMENSGAVNVLYGSSSGLAAAGDQIWDQDTPHISETAEAGDGFGRALAAGDFNGDSYADLAIGVPYEDFGSPLIDGAGVVHIVSGSSTGLAIPGGDQLWYQGRADASGTVAGAAEASDFFGYALAAIPRTTHRLYLPHVLR